MPLCFFLLFFPTSRIPCAMSKPCVCQAPESGTETSHVGQTQAQPPPQEAGQDQPRLNHISHPLPPPPPASHSPSGLSHLALVHISVGSSAQAPGMFSLPTQSVSLSRHDVNRSPRPRARTQQEGAGRTPAKAWALLRSLQPLLRLLPSLGEWGGEHVLTLFRFRDSLLP